MPLRAAAVLSFRAIKEKPTERAKCERAGKPWRALGRQPGAIGTSVPVVDGSQPLNLDFPPELDVAAAELAPQLLCAQDAQQVQHFGMACLVHEECCRLQRKLVRLQSLNQPAVPRSLWAVLVNPGRTFLKKALVLALATNSSDEPERTRPALYVKLTVGGLGDAWSLVDLSRLGLA